MIRRRAALALAALLAGLTVLAVTASSRPRQSPAREPITVIPFAHPESVRHGMLGRGETLGALFIRLGVSGAEARHWVSAAGRELNLRALPVGLEGVATLNHHGIVRRIHLVQDWQWEILLALGGDGIESERRRRPVDRDLWVVRGEVRSSLFGAVLGAGETESLAVALADAFQWDIDFHRDVREGDSFAVVVERVQSNGRTVAYGPILAATYTNRGRAYTAVRFAAADAGPGYYDAEGRPLRKLFLRSPLRFSRITSRFSPNRMHPVLGRRMPHVGVDYAAPTGTPIMATAAGTVSFRGWKGGGGNTVEVRHPAGYQTSYLHMSRFASGVSVGTRVSQGQVIGFVGATGLATGPHVCYRVHHHGRYVNPLSVGRDPAPPLPADELPRFAGWAEQVLALLETPGGVSETVVAALRESAPVAFDA